MNTVKHLMLGCVFAALVWSPVQGQDYYNARYGENVFSKLPHGGMTSKTPWVGSWWAYIKDGMAFR